MFSVIENSLNLDALYLVKLIFGEYFCYFDSNRVTVLLQLQLHLGANRVLVRERVNSPNDISLSTVNQSQAKFKSAMGGNLLQTWVNLTIIELV